MTFDDAFDVLMDPKHEGEYTAGKGDPGGETKYGISKRAYPNVDIKALTRADAKAIYLRDYWSKIRADDLPESIRFDVFDTAVNSGLTVAAKLLQRAAFVSTDGVIGPRTLRAVDDMPEWKLVARFNGARLEFMAGLPHWDRFGKGWARRIAANLLNA